MSNPRYNCDSSSDQFGDKFNDGLGNVGHQYNYHNGQVLDPYRLELDFFVYDNERLDNPCYSDNPPLIRSVLSPLTDTVTLVALIGIVVVRSLIHIDLNQISLRVVKVVLIFLNLWVNCWSLWKI